MRRFVLSLTAFATLIVVAPAASGQDSNKEDFDAFCEAMTGRFVGDVKLVADWPGEGEKGDKITGYAELRPVADSWAWRGRDLFQGVVIVEQSRFLDHHPVLCRGVDQTAYDEGCDVSGSLQVRQTHF